MSAMEKQISPGRVRELLEDHGIDVTAQEWPGTPGRVVIGGVAYEPATVSGTLLADGEPVFSAAWR